jgi:hypothetical protein
MNESWIPLHLRQNDGNAFTGAVEGVPPYMAKSIWNWVDQQFITGTSSYSNGHFDLELLRKVELALKKDFPIDTWDLDFALEELHRLFAVEVELLDLVHHLLKLQSDWVSQLDLEEILSLAGSAWRVETRDGRAGLVRRVAPELEDILRQTSELDPQASEYLAAAYANTFGREPNYDHAFDLAIKAVEQASIPRMNLPGKFKTLGRVMEHVKSGSFGLLVPMPDAYSFVKHSLLADACEVLWRSNEWRHAGKAAKATPVSKAQAEVATTLATTLVYLITAPGLAGPLNNQKSRASEKLES